MVPPSREWHGSAEGVEAEAMAALRAAAPVQLPEEYFQLLAWRDGGEGPLPVDPFWFALYPAAEAEEVWRSGRFNEFFPGFVVFGGNGGGEAIAFDTRSGAPWPVVMFDMCNTNLAESVRAIASDFASFLGLVGLSEPD